MRRYISIIVVLLYCRIAVFSIEINKEYAAQIGVAFLQQKANADGLPVMQLLSSDVECLTDTAFPHLYILNTENGWAIMSTDTRVQPILAYSIQNAHFDVNNIPDGLRCLLYDYDDAIRFAQDSLSDMEDNAEWEQIRTFDTGKESKVVLARCTEVLWNQDVNNGSVGRCSPSYNQLCPTFYTPACGHTYVGCVAVAIGQIMWYYKWPYYAVVPNSISTTGEPSTDSHIQWYNWDKMPYALFYTTPSDQSTMVATFLRDCGYAAKLQYGNDGTGGNIKNAMEALMNTFGYSSNISHHKKSLTINWIKKLKAEIDAGRPVLYRAERRNGGGHEFVVDGYEGDRFYINWGWGDTLVNNGTYALDLLQPNGKTIVYSQGHEALFGIEPAVVCGSASSKGTVTGNVPYIQVVGGEITLHDFTVNANAKCYCYSGTQIRLTDGFVAKAGSFAHFAIRDVPCNTARSVMHVPAYEEPSQEENTGDIVSKTKGQLSVLPNPATDRISVQYDVEVVSVMIFTTMGQQVLSTRETDIDISNLSAGTYILYANTATGAERTMFIKQ